MTEEDFNRKYSEIKQKGLPYIVEINRLRHLRREYYTDRIEDTRLNIQDNIKRNVRFLMFKIGRGPTRRSIDDYMSVDVHHDLDVYLKHNFGPDTLTTIITLSEFYRIPIEKLMFEDLTVYGDDIKKHYPVLIGEGRFSQPRTNSWQYTKRFSGEFTDVTPLDDITEEQPG